MVSVCILGSGPFVVLVFWLNTPYTLCSVNRLHAAVCGVAEPPYFVEPLEPMEVTAGDAVCLKCQVAGTPEIKVSWFKADGKLSKATKADVGEYTCKSVKTLQFSPKSPRSTSRTPGANW
uniref:Ig-like domain-containing protein n=1 Tax=Stegastes partitus TaxID=144197 RepID=A0A3B5B987_9TELE